MQTQVDFISGMRKLLSHHNIISISGESGTGKTTLALQLAGSFLTYEAPYEDSCIWVQASEPFSLTRLRQIFQDQKSKLEYIQNNIFVIPHNSPINTYEQQISLFQKIIHPEFNVPPLLKYIVIDNISHHLRYKLIQYNNPKDLSSLLDGFYEVVLMPLILFCKHYDIVLILIHEVTFSPKDECNRPFFYKLYDRIKTIDIELSNNYNDDKKSLLLSYEESVWNFQYILGNGGMLII
ncbi:MAG: AAA family ATPase [Candidatus Hodarchaeota archaeon]